MIAKIKKHVHILDITERFGIDVEEVSVGNFTHRCKCPNKEHKSGTERTGSCYINGNQNNFYCFGCQANNSSIDFYMLCSDLSFSEAMDCLKPLVRDIDDDLEYKRKENNFDILFQMSEMIYDKIKEDPFCIDQIKSIIRQVDDYIITIKPNDIKKARFLKHKLEKKLEEI